MQLVLHKEMRVCAALFHAEMYKKCAACHIHCGTSHYQEQIFFHKQNQISPVIHCHFFLFFF